MVGGGGVFMEGEKEEKRTQISLQISFRLSIYLIINLIGITTCILMASMGR